MEGSETTQVKLSGFLRNLDLVALIVVASAGIYGIGWFFEHQLVLFLGVGSLAISKESSIAAGMAFLLTFSGMLIAAFWALAPSISNISPDRAFSVPMCVTAVGHLFLALSGTINRSTADADVAFQSLFYWGLLPVLLVQLVFVLGLSLKLSGRKSVGVRMMTLATLVAVPFALLFPGMILKKLPPYWGGYLNHKCLVDTNVPSTLLFSDATHVILKRDTGEIERLPWSHIDRIVKAED